MPWTQVIISTASTAKCLHPLKSSHGRVILHQGIPIQARKIANTALGWLVAAFGDQPGREAVIPEHLEESPKDLSSAADEVPVESLTFVGNRHRVKEEPEGSGTGMILSVAVHRRYRQIDDARDLDLLVEELATGLAPGNPWVNMDCGEIAELYFADSALTEEMFDEPPFDWQAHSMLTVSVNSTTGLGAVRWNLTSASINPQPPRDPRVVCDPEVPYWFHPRHVLPASLVLAAVREFCQRQGEAPTCIEWTDFNLAADSYLDPDQYRKLFPSAA